MRRYSYPKPHSARRRAGFNLIELLIALIIIGVLTSMLVPTVGRRAEQARITACQDELRRLADAEERAATDLNYYLRLFALDDSATGDGIGFGPNDTRDGIGDETINTVFTVSPAVSLFITLKTQEVVNFGSQGVADAAYRRLFGIDNMAVAGGTTANKWLGPYITFTNDEKGAAAFASLISPHLPGIPNDPWGNDYVFFVGGDVNNITNSVPAGAIIEPTGVVQGTYLGKDATKFGRPTILSLGPNGVAGDGTGGTEGQLGKGDDLMVQFGG